MKYLLALVSSLLISTSWAGVGIVTETKGSNACEIQRAKSKLPGNKGASVESMDTFITGSCAGQITFNDETKVKVTENSKLLIDDFVYDPKKSDAGKLAIKVAMGTVRYASGQVAKANPQQVAINTPTATIAVRGTDFTMTVDEAGSSLVVLLPSCKDEKDVKKYELEENRCRVGKIEVSTLAGKVTLEEAFQATYVFSVSMVPTNPTVINTVEGKIDNSLIIAKPQEVQRAIKEAGKSKQDKEIEDIELEAQRQLAQRVKQAQEAIDQARVIAMVEAAGKANCNASTNVCVNWEKNDSPDIQGRGKGTAFRSNPDHYAEVKTQGYDSNTLVNITHDDAPASFTIGSGDPGGNVINIKQNTGVYRLR